LFHLAQELLAEVDLLLGLDAPTATMAMSSGGAMLTTGLPLLGKVRKRVRSFQLADCQVVGDIDALVPGGGGPGALPDDDAGGGAL